MNPQDPLSQLRDIHLPNPINWWPPAIGWWIVVVLLCAAIALLVMWQWRRYRRLAYKRAAIAELLSIKTRYDIKRDDLTLLSDISALLKRACITRYSRETAAGLTGESWLAFLDKTGESQAFTQGAGKVLGAARFDRDPNIEAPELIIAAQQWLDKQS